MLSLFFLAASLAPTELDWMARKIWHNECGSKVENLLSWNQGEEFLSLGIGHFIWYPEGKEGPFEEGFPALLRFLEREGVQLPSWLRASQRCPWKSRDQFLKSQHDPKIGELRSLLASTLPLQARWIAERLDQVLPKLTTGLSSGEQQHVAKMFYRVADLPQGRYILADYLNFKGAGTSPTERYQGKGWGLLQVLQLMPDTGISPAEEFVAAAREVLQQRVAHSPPERGEQRWLPGWFARLETYLTAGSS